MNVTDSKTAADIIKEVDVILRKGNDVLIQNRRNGVVVIEQKKKVTLKIENENAGLNR